MENLGFEKEWRAPEDYQDKKILRTINGQDIEYTIRSYPEEDRMALLNEDGKKIGQLIYNTVQYDPTKLRVLDVRINEEERGNNLGLELYKQLISLAEQKGLKGIVSTNSISFYASTVWKKLGDEGYSLKVHPSAEAQYAEFLKNYESGNRIEGNIAFRFVSGETNAVFEIDL